MILYVSAYGSDNADFRVVNPVRVHLERLYRVGGGKETQGSPGLQDFEPLLIDGILPDRGDDTVHSTGKLLEDRIDRVA